MKTRQAGRAGITLAAGIAAIMILLAVRVAAENPAVPSIDLPNPYAAGVRFGQLPEGRQWGGVIAVTPDRDGRSIWAFERCGGNCLNSDLPPVLEFDPSGKLIKSFGAGMFVFPHGIAVDKEDNVREYQSSPQNGPVSPVGPVSQTLLDMSLLPTPTARTARVTSSSNSTPTARC